MHLHERETLGNGTTLDTLVAVQHLSVTLFGDFVPVLKSFPHRRSSAQRPILGAGLWAWIRYRRVRQEWV